MLERLDAPPPPGLAVEGARPLPWTELTALAGGTRALFAERGLVPGDTIFVATEDAWTPLVLLLACVQARLCLVVADPRLSAASLAGMSTDSGAKLAFADAALAMPTLRPGAPRLVDRLLGREAAYPASVRNRSAPPPEPGAPEDRLLAFASTAVLGCTRAMTRQDIEARLRVAQGTLKLDAPRFVSLLPPWHPDGLLLSVLLPWTTGGRTALAMTPLDALDRVASTRATHLLFEAAQVDALLALGAELPTACAHSTYAATLSAGSVLPDRSRMALEGATAHPVVDLYTASETQTDVRPSTPAPEPLADELPIEATVLTLAARIFRVARSSLSLSTAPDQCPGWDSMAHLDLLEALDTAFGVRIGARAFASVRSLADAAAAVRAARR